MFSWISKWLIRCRARRNVGKFVRFGQYCEFGRSVHEGVIVGVLDDCYVIRSGGVPRTAWFHEIEFVKNNVYKTP